MADVEVAVFGAGCFWCLDAVARRIKGFQASVVGYAGGDGPRPSYRDLHYGGNIGDFVEAVKLDFDPSILTYEDVLSVFFQSHDPTTPNQDGANYGPEYHSTIFYADEDQHDRARRFVDEEQSMYRAAITTTLRPLVNFYEAEVEHQDFYNRNPTVPYCRVVIDPKLRKLGLA